MSDYCEDGQHEDCDGCNLDNAAGCLCSCHYDKDDE